MSWATQLVKPQNISNITVWLTVCYYHVTYAFQSKSTLYGCLNVKEFLAQNRRDIWRLSDSNVIRTHNHLVCKRTLNNLAKLASGSVFVYKLSGCGFEFHCFHLISLYLYERKVHEVLEINKLQYLIKKMEH